MPRKISNAILTVAALALTLAEPVGLDAAGRKVVRRTTVVVSSGHPIRRSVTRTVIVRPARTRVIVKAPRVFLPVVRFGAVAVVSLPPRDRLVWQDSEAIRRNDDWVDMNFGVDQRGDALLLAIDGRARLDFAEVEFENGQAQVVDFNEGTHSSGLYPLLNFADGRRVMNVRLLAKSETPRTKFTVYLKK